MRFVFQAVVLDFFQVAILHAQLCLRWFCYAFKNYSCARVGCL